MEGFITSITSSSLLHLTIMTKVIIVKEIHYHFHRIAEQHFQLKTIAMIL